MITNKDKKSPDHFQRESNLVHYVILLGLLCALSGILITVFGESFGVWLQWNVIGHSIVGGLGMFYILPYSYYHYRRTVGIRKSGVLLSGILSFAVLLSVFVSGVWIVFEGQQEALPQVPLTHLVTAYVAIFFTILHLVLHWLNRSRQRKKKEKPFITVSKPDLSKVVLTGTGCYVFMLISTSLGYSALYANPVQDLPASYQTDYGSHPFRPSLTETSNQELIHLDQIAKSQQCAACHEDVYKEWVSSTHRQAASDPTYVKNINLLVKNKGVVAARYCEGCHAPVALLTGELTEGGSHGGIADTPANLEGVGCMGCHGIESVVSTSGTASYHFSPKEHYLFDSSSSRLAQRIRNFLIQTSPGKHKKAMAGDVLKDPKLCATCHEQFMDKDINNWGWVKMQSTYQSWLKSPFSAQNDQIHSDSASMRCQDCHFAKTPANDPSADQNGLVASHRSLGANTVLPLLNGDTKQLEETKRFMQSAKMLIHIEKPTPVASVTSKQFVDQGLRFSTTDEVPYFLYLGDTGKLSVTVTNRLVGHSFPSGTNDLNQAWLYFRVTDGNDRTVYVSGELDQQRILDKTAHTYHAIPVDRYGKRVWRHDLFRMTGEVYKNVIPAGQSDIKSYDFTVPSWAKSPLTVEAVLRYRKLNQQYASWALESSDIEIPVVDMARDTLTVPIKIRQSATSTNQ